jgi:hypothetical protein
MACGWRWALPFAALVATFCVQTHVGYLPLALPVLAWGAAWLVAVELKRTSGRSTVDRLWPFLPVAAITVVVLGLAWTPPLVQQVRDDPGNLTELVRYFRESDEPMPTAAEALRAVVGQFSSVPQWITGDTDVDPFTSEPRLLRTNPVPVLLVPFAIGWFLLWRRSERAGARLAATLVVALVAGVLSVARTLGPAFAYRLRWTWLLGMMAIVVAAWATWVHVANRSARGERLMVVGVVIALLGLAGSGAVRAATAGVPYEHRSAVMRALEPSLERALPASDSDDEILVETTSFAGTFYKSGVVLWLERRGVDGRVAAADEDAYGSHRVVRAGQPPARVWTVATDEDLDRLAATPGQRLIAYWGESTSAERRRVSGRRARLEAAHAAGRLGDAAFLDALLALEPGQAVGVFARQPS